MKMQKKEWVNLKTCNKCGGKKVESEFYQKHSECKTCSKLYSKKYWKINKERISAKQTEYRKTPAGKAVQVRARKKYQQTPQGKAAARRGNKKYKINKAISKQINVIPRFIDLDLILKVLLLWVLHMKAYKILKMDNLDSTEMKNIYFTKGLINK